jgi:hypothetical protein
MIMKKARGASVGGGAKTSKGKTANESQADTPAVISGGGKGKTWKYTNGIRILGVGESAEGDRFLEVAVKSKTALLNVDNISAHQSPELKALTRLGEPLIRPEAKREFIERAHDAARAEPSFRVAMMTGYLEDEFIFPVGLAPDGEMGVRRYCDYRYARYHRRVRREGSPKGWLELAELCRGKSRLITGLCLALSGPVCGKFGDEPPAIQLVSEGGRGNTTIGRVAGTVWGGDRNASRRIGCGVSWNNTGLNVEVLAGAFNHMFLYMDDMHNAGEADLKAIQNTMNGEGRGRSTDAQRTEFCTPMLSSSNASIIVTATELKRKHLIVPLIDRLMELSLPAGCRYLFEGIKTKAEFRAYGNQLRKGARENFGWAGPEFVKRLDEWAATDSAAVQAFVDQRHDAYFDGVTDIASTNGRDLGRIENKFATIYVSGCLAVRLKILPFTEAEILDAVRTCHRDHVAFIDEQMEGRRTATMVGPVAASAASARRPIAAPEKPAERPLDRLRRYVNLNRKGGVLDIDKVGAGGSFMPSDVGYKHKHGRGKSRYTEYLIPDTTFEEVAGGPDEADALKRELHDLGLLSIGRRGDGVSYVVKRTLPDGSRPYFVALRAKPKQRWA